MKLKRGHKGLAADPHIERIYCNDETLVIDERGQRSAFGDPLGRALADAYEMENEHERRFDQFHEDTGYFIYPE
jgi:hypothetical protein